MIVIDSSALCAVLLKESDARVFAEAISRANGGLLSAANFVESAMILESRREESGALELDVALIDGKIEIAPITLEIARAARIAFRLYGKGRHPAALNFGDCFTYALAKVTGYPVLAKGPEFAQTDIEIVAT